MLNPALCQTTPAHAITATSYVELIIRRIRSPALLRPFLVFLVAAEPDAQRYANVRICYYCFWACMHVILLPCLGMHLIL